MIECLAMSDRMPDVAHGRISWTEAEAKHLAVCAECALEWRIVRAGTLLDADTTLAADRVAESVTLRLRDDDGAGSIAGRIPWRGPAIGLVAAAASVLLILGIGRRPDAPSAAMGDSVVAVAMLPELEGLDAGQLQSVLQSLGPTAADATPGVLPHLGDLTDNELEELLRSEGGQ